MGGSLASQLRFSNIIEIFWINEKTAAKEVNKIKDRNQLD